MIERTKLAEDFIAGSDWAGALRSPLAGDASNRRYERLHRDGETAVLMDAPPEKGEDIRPFVAIAHYLTDLGLSAPQVWAEDAENGFLILEDLGDGLFARAIPDHPELEAPLYQAATDVLTRLHSAGPPQNLARYSPEVMTDLAALAWTWYKGGNDPSEQVFRASFEPVLEHYAADHSVLIQRDYHAENLLWLPDRDGTARVGLLDFQDAMAGHRAYDLVSLLQDARRDVPPEIETAMIRRYVVDNQLDPVAFQTAYAVLGAQRNLRILGVFARLCLRDGKAHYVDLIPRVWALLLRDLDHPALVPVKPIVLNALPKPTSDYLQDLKQKCATARTL
ncbi:aminoglycoside phosphotransferase family protein [Thalassovita gelatinovora]|uniref:aminoglycoside phosphotransferase family protein n=1 Tax=Thalassovita gelatinovora TaxID=53501 RepID=UPI00071E5741|nr:phosphotransferase [Thalassovita gelatinovora]QIZ81035.1 phosphotransferase [Thalassovita gelatinovora]